jgi:MATE family, multidrug efflux pump
MGLTRHRSGSVGELLTISLPLMLSSLSLMTMIFCDRLFLARFSGSAMSASVTAGTLGWACLGSGLIIASMAEVFVAQYNGAGIRRRLGEPVWQMIWFSFAMIPLYLVLGIWGGPLFFADSSLRELEVTYFFWLTAFGFGWPLLGALSAFWVAQGKTMLIMFLSLAANVVNIVLDWLLIFGIEGVLEPQGIRGAAIATVLGTFAQVIVLAVLFLDRRHREEHGTGHMALKFRELRKILRVGVPQATLFFVEMMGWTLFYVMITTVGREQVFVAGICQSILILFFFASEGIGRGAIAIAGNMIGASRASDAVHVFWSGVKLHFTFFVIVFLAFAFLPHVFSDLFMGDNFRLLGEGGVQEVILDEEREVIAELLHRTLFLCAIYLFVEGIRWLVSGLLTAAGDTRFLMVVGILGVGLFLLLPTYVVVQRLHFGVFAAFVISIIFPLAISIAFLWRFFGNRWQRTALVADTA